MARSLPRIFRIVKPVDKSGLRVRSVIALTLGLLAMADPGEAVPISSYVGNDPAINTVGVGIDGSVNFAVFTSAQFSNDAAGILGPAACGTSCFKSGLGSPALDLGAGIFVYLYQVANSGTNSTPITNFSAGRSPGVDVTSWGFFRNDSAGRGIVFTQAGVQVTATNPLNWGATSVGFAVDSGVNPSLVVSPSLIFRASTSLQASFNIPAGGTSSLLVYTSHYSPGWFNGQINGGGVGANDPLPGASVPEPGTLLLMTTGLAGLIGLRRRISRLERNP